MHNLTLIDTLIIENGTAPLLPELCRRSKERFTHYVESGDDFTIFINEDDYASVFATAIIRCYLSLVTSSPVRPIQASILGAGLSTSVSGKTGQVAIVIGHAFDLVVLRLLERSFTTVFWISSEEKVKLLRNSEAVDGEKVHLLLQPPSEYQLIFQGLINKDFDPYQNTAQFFSEMEFIVSSPIIRDDVHLFASHLLSKQHFIDRCLAASTHHELSSFLWSIRDELKHTLHGKQPSCDVDLTFPSLVKNVTMSRIEKSLSVTKLKAAIFLGGVLNPNAFEDGTVDFAIYASLTPRGKVKLTVLANHWRKFDLFTEHLDAVVHGGVAHLEMSMPKFQFLFTSPFYVK